MIAIGEMVLNCNMSPITIGRSLGKASGCAMAVYCSRAVATTRYWFRVRLRLGGFKIAIEIHKYATYKNYMYSHNS